ncbi:sensor histidine kinase [Mycolicibacterium moriokaense]|uniref:histidine kinase n=1 Tax=Mycolicibacterium moriokaense TaxID=39691 RepID=A0A318H0M9_9MYCO|nr:ATP-binding protein [Mycolicibacterium moriokaense]PXW96291.1 signal transduction histidine kinase [Mycolicibacterium moriokaense]
MFDRLVAAARRIRARVGTVRAGTTAVATVFVAIALVAGAMVLLTVLRGTLIDEVKDSAGAQALEVAGQLDSGQPPILEVAPSDEQLIQVLGPDGSVLASSRNVTGEAAVARLRPGESAQVLTPLDNEAFMAVAEGAQTPAGPRTVLVARALIGVFETTALVTQLLIIGLPLLLLVVAVTTWFTVGRALAPVEAIRREVDEISAAQLHRRVPQPDADDEIGRMAATMNRMLARLEDARNSQRRFVSDASHELRSPITTIRQHAEVALAHPDGTTTEELAEVVLAEELRIQRLVEDLVLLAQSDEHVPPPRAPVDLDDLVFEEASRLRATTSLRVDTSAVGAARVHGNADALRRVLRNLGENAARHATSRIDITLADRGSDVLLTVGDDGPGIPETERERVLQRFVRLDESRSRDDGGSGLGLAIVDEIVRAHRGSVAISRSPLGGARITVSVPASDS